MFLSKLSFLYMLQEELPVSLLILEMELPTLSLFMMDIHSLMLLWELISLEEILLIIWLNYVEKSELNLLHLLKEKLPEILKKNSVMLLKILMLKWKNTTHQAKKIRHMNYPMETKWNSEIKDSDALKPYLIPQWLVKNIKVSMN